jgi:hypothetical protein
MLEKYKSCNYCQIHHNIRILFRLKRKKIILVPYICYPCILKNIVDLSIEYNGGVPIQFYI